MLDDANLWFLLTAIDQKVADKVRSGGCPCGGTLYSARYSRKPRGWPREQLGVDYESRLSFCCDQDGCRRRCTPQSVRGYRCRIKSLLIRWYKSPEPNASKTWVLYDTVHSQHRRADLQRLVGRPKGLFKWRGPSVNPYLRTDERKTLTSRYADVAIAMSNA